MLERDGNVEELYDRWARSYDADPNRTRDRAAWVLRRREAMFAGRDVLELGCGTGLNTEWLARQARRVAAVDFSRGMLRQAEARVRAAHVRFLRHDLVAPLPFSDASWDVVAFVLVLEHMESLAEPIAEAARVLRPRGVLFVCEYHPCRQLAGSQARFRPGAATEEVRIPAYVHLAGDYVRAGLAADLRLSGMDEWGDEEDGSGSPPRVLSLTFEKP